MRISFLNRIRSWPVSRRDDAVVRDADALLREWGDAAYDRATYLSWEEDFGIVVSATPGHWWRVRRELANRLDRREVDPRAEFVAPPASGAKGTAMTPVLGVFGALRLGAAPATRAAK